jgi:hypothetical protein
MLRLRNVSKAQWPVCTLLAALVLVSGCGKSGAQSTVSGSVTLHGVAIESGSVLFAPIGDTPGGTAGTSIAAGSFAVDRGLVPGTYRVEVRAPRPSDTLIPKPFGAPGEMITASEEAVAEEFNDRSTLFITLNPGANTMSVDVSSRGAKK